MKLFKPELFCETKDGLFLVGQKCTCCGHIAYPRKRVCPECFSDELEDYLLSRKGILHTYTCTYLGAPHLEGPYVIGYVDLPEAVRVLSPIISDDPEGKDLYCEMPVEMLVEPYYKDESGEDIYTYKFRPIKE